MDYTTAKRFLQVITQRNVNLNIRLALFAFFVAVASILWYLNKLTYEYTTEITFPLRVENMPRGKVLVGEPPRRITLQVKAYGYTLLRYKLGSSLSPIVIDLEQTPLLSLNGSNTKSYLLTNALRNSIANQLQGELQLGVIATDSLHFEFTTMEQKKVKVTPVLNYTLERQHMFTGPIRVSPDSITISGPGTLIDTINTIKTRPLRIDRLSTHHSSSVLLSEMQQVGFSHRRVNIIIPVEKFTEANLSKSIEVKNLPDTLRLILLPRIVNLKCNVLISSYGNLFEEDLVRPFVDFSNSQDGTGNKLRIQVESDPFVVRVVDIEPKYVDFIIERI